jgi:hypothetical protein
MREIPGMIRKHPAVLDAGNSWHRRFASKRKEGFTAICQEDARPSIDEHTKEAKPLCLRWPLHPVLTNGTEHTWLLKPALPGRTRSVENLLDVHLFNTPKEQSPFACAGRCGAEACPSG